MVNFMVVFTMLFHGGMIPTFLVVKELGLIDTYASLILPSAISAFNMIILRNFFQNIPEGLEESVKLMVVTILEYYFGLYCHYPYLH